MPTIATRFARKRCTFECGLHDVFCESQNSFEFNQDGVGCHNASKQEIFFKNLFHILHNALTAITILTLLTYNTNNAYYTNHIYNVQNQNVHTTTTKKTIHIPTKIKKEKKVTTTTT